MTEPARQVMVQAQQEARGLAHDHLSSEHLLLGLLAVREDVAGRVLESLGLSLPLVRGRVARKVGVGDRDSPEAIPFTPRAKRIIALAVEEAVELGDELVRTEHILRAVLREHEAVAAGILRDLDVNPDQACRLLNDAMPSGTGPWRPIEAPAVDGSIAREDGPPLKICSDLSPADWIVTSDIPWWQLALFGPAGFAAYARLRFIPDPTHEGQRVFDGDAEALRSERDQWRDLLELLAAGTADPNDCFFALWDGWGDFPESTRRWPRFSIPRGAQTPTRSYFLFRGPLSQAADWDRAEFARNPTTQSDAPPAFVWPPDHAWCVAKDVDPHWAGIGGDHRLIEQLQSARDLDVVAAIPSERQPAYG